MASKLISALAATALIAAAPSLAVAQDYDDDDGGIGKTELALGVIFALIAGVILFWDGDGDPISP
jgi:hypothetical protein